jgi:hypothetical protein
MTRTYADAHNKYYWELFLRGYHNDDLEAKEEFASHLGLNRAGRRKLEAKARKLRKKHSADGV